MHPRPRHLTRAAAVSLLLALAVMLSACGTAPSPAPVATLTSAPSATSRAPATPSPAITQPATPAPASAPAGVRGIELRFWHPWVGEMASDMQVLVDLFNHTNDYGIHVVASELGGSGELFNRVLAAGGQSMPDLVVARSEQIAAWHAKGVPVADLDALLRDAQWGFSAEDLSDFPLPYLSQDLHGESRLGIPAQAGMHFLIYNETWAKALGYNSPPATTEQFSQQACAAAKANRFDEVVANDGTGGYLADSTPEALLGWLTAFGGGAPGMSSPGGAQQAAYNSAANAQALAYLKGLQDLGCAWVGKNPDPYNYFAIRYGLFYNGSLDDLAAQAQAMQRAGNRDVWRVIPYPRADGGDGVVIGEQESYAILTPDEDRAMAAWLFARWLSQPEPQISLMQATSGLPLRASIQPRLSGLRAAHPQWAQAVDLMGRLVMPPGDAAWRQERGLLQDAAQQLFQPETVAAQLPDLLAMLDDFAAELKGRAP